jgi:hypothetical protein
VDEKSYKDGKSGLPAGPDTDINSYRIGQQDREAEAKKGMDWSHLPKVDISGVGYTLLLISPFLYMVYPTLGVTLFGSFLVVLTVTHWLHVPDFPAILLLFALCVASFFPGMKLEVMASQFKIYRALRVPWRMVNFFSLPVIINYGRHADSFDKASGPALFAGIVLAILMHFILQKADRLYFPVLLSPAEKKHADDKARKRGEVLQDLTVISGAVSGLTAAEKGKWNFRIGNQPVSMTAALDMKDGKQVLAAGHPRDNRFIVLVLNDQTAHASYEVPGPSKMPWVLAILVFFVSAFFIRAFLSLLMVPVIWVLVGKWLQKKKEIRQAQQMIWDSESPSV